MTDQEREQILKMIENGTISPEDGLKLMRTLDQTPAEDEVTAGDAEAGAGKRSGSEAGTGQKTSTQGEGQEALGDQSRFETDARISRVKSTVRRLWQIPLWIGVLITLLGAWGMYSLVQVSKLNFWFYCLNVPLLILGVLVILAAVGSRKARWIFVDVHQKPGEKPGRIFLGFPLPLKFAAGLMRIIQQLFPHLALEIDGDKGRPGKDGNIKIDGIVRIMELVDKGFTGDEPLVVNVDEGEEGERVQVYIG
jgi:hypothetical protein